MFQTQGLCMMYPPLLPCALGTCRALSSASWRWGNPLMSPSTSHPPISGQLSDTSQAGRVHRWACSFHRWWPDLSGEMVLSDRLFYCSLKLLVLCIRIHVLDMIQGPAYHSATQKSAAWPNLYSRSSLSWPNIPFCLVLTL